MRPTFRFLLPAVFLFSMTALAKNLAHTLPHNYILTKDKPRARVSEWLKGRMHFGSNNGTIARWLEHEKSAVLGIEYLLKFFDSTSRRMKKISNAAESKGASRDVRRLYCDGTAASGHYYRARQILSFVGLGELPESKPCITELEDDDNEELISAIKRVTDGLNKVAENISSEFRGHPPYTRRDPRFQFGNWSYAEANSRYTYNTTHKRCTVEHAVGFRVDGHWSVAVHITNAPPFAMQPEWKRHFISEALVLRPGRDRKLGSFPMNLRLNISGVEKGVSATTVYSTWGSRAQHSCFGISAIIQNSALQASLSQLSKSSGVRKEVEDSTTVSNILILIMPLVMVLLPVGLLGQVSGLFTLFYSFATDFMTVMPLAVKGVELLVFESQKKSLAVRTNFLGSGTNLTALAAAETWAAECFPGDQMRSLGISFISIALAAMVIGFSLEIFAYKLIKRRERKALALLAKSISPEVLWTKEIMPCNSCNCSVGALLTFLEYDDPLDSFSLPGSNTRISVRS